MTVAIIGASGGLGKALARGWAARGHDLMLVGRRAEVLQTLAADVAHRYEVSAQVKGMDVSAAGAVDALVGDQPFAIDHWLIILGVLSDQDRANQLDGETTAKIIATNLTAPLLLASKVLSQKPKSIVAAGSIAAIRGRTANTAYAAAKRGLESGWESLAHAAPKTVAIQLYRLGFMDTAMARGRAPAALLARPDSIAASMIRRIERGGHGRFHRSRYWAPAGWATKALPARIWRRVKG